jgi:hypothetical protein
MNPHCWFPSTWKDARLGLLTNARITAYALMGKYGTQVKNVFINARTRRLLKSKAKLFTLTKPCQQCNNPKAPTRWYRWYSWLPRSGYYCAVCEDRLHREWQKERELAAKVRAAEKAAMEEYY